MAGVFPASVYITSIVMNGLVRIVAILAGAYVVWLGHNTLILGVRGKFAFEGRFGKLKGSAPGLLFVLLGSLAIGWALQAAAVGVTRGASLGDPRQQADGPSGDTGETGGASDQEPTFLKPRGDGEQGAAN